MGIQIASEPTNAAFFAPELLIAARMPTAATPSVKAA